MSAMAVLLYDQFGMERARRSKWQFRPRSSAAGASEVPDAEKGQFFGSKMSMRARTASLRGMYQLANERSHEHFAT
ncbi:hypothetical protein ICN83_20930 (plasmid) [Sphingopyxis granuli]|nr:hypothetical protein ICN83_20930 [Sphingopyxis granuli]